MNDPPRPSKDQKQLPDDPHAQRIQASESSEVASLPVASRSPVQNKSIPPPGGLPPMNDGLASANVSAQLGKTVPPTLMQHPPNLDPMKLLGAAAMAHQQHQLQNAGILKSLMDQKEQITKCEDEIRRRMLLPPSDPLLQAHLVQNDPGRFLSAMGLMGNLAALSATPLAASLARLPSPLMQDPRLPRGGNRSNGGVIEPFPEKLHRLLQETEAAGKADVISFVGNGRAFMIHKPDRFFKEIVPLYFNHKRLSSFKRQLNLYSFELISTGDFRGAYFHELFVKGRPELCVNMRRSVQSKAYSRRRVAQPDVASPDGKQPPSTAAAKGEDANKSVDSKKEGNAARASSSA